MTTSYHDLTIRQQLAIAKIEREGGDELDVQTAILSVLSGLSVHDLLQLPVAEYAALAAKKRFLDGPFPKGDAEAIQKVGGYELVPTTDLSRMNVSQFVDFQELCRQGPEALADILAVFYVPKGCVYGASEDEKGGYNAEAVKEAILSLSSPDAMAAYAFFLTSFSASCDRLLTSSKWKVAKVRNPRKRAELEARVREVEKMASLLAGDGLIR